MSEKEAQYGIIISGSRTLDSLAHREAMEECLDHDLKSLLRRGIKGYFGDAKGIDAFAKAYCNKRDYAYQELKPLWAVYGKAAGPLRNEGLIEQAKEECLYQRAFLFWDGKSPGTKAMLNSCRKYHVFTLVYVWNPTIKGFLQNQRKLFE